jgi:nicotinate phosphoribosyltransferase
MNNQIITSVLDSDLYKFTMQQCVLHQYPEVEVGYEFRCRNKDVKLGFLADEIREQIDAMKNLCLTPEERNYLLLSCPFLTSDYLDYLTEYRFDRGQVNVSKWNGNLLIGIDGKWVDNILWEVPILAIVNELYFSHLTTKDNNRVECCEIGYDKLNEKIEMLKPYPNFKFAEFGTRRRFSKDWQNIVVKNLEEKCHNIIGTSNVALAMETGLKPIGTVAHEWFSAHLSLVEDVKNAQKKAMYTWLMEYDNDLGIVLTDTFTTDAFFRDFGTILSNAFEGLRHDSGDPIEFGYKAIKHYKGMNIDPKTKSLVFSDGLDIPEALRIYREFTGLIGVSFGIGTDLTNDCSLDHLATSPHPTRLNIVIKAIRCNNKPVVKLSDNPSKAIGDKNMIEKVKKAYRVL